MANFRTKARAIDLLGKNQIADLPTAITELWKNGYDAYGDYLDAYLLIKGYKDIKTDTFILSDDGFGMTESDILNKWIVLGTDSKRGDGKDIPEEDRFGKDYRVPLGEKGIGRLSVAYLGSHMLMVTKKVNNPFQLVFMNWGVLDNSDLYIEDITIPVISSDSIDDVGELYSTLIEEYRANLEVNKWQNFKDLKRKIENNLKEYSSISNTVLSMIVNHFDKHGHGTMFIIFDPISELTNLAEFSASEQYLDKEEYRNRTRYVRSALSGLFNPFDDELQARRKKVLGADWNDSPSFHIMTRDRDHDFLKLNEFFTQKEFDECEHSIEGTFDENGFFSGTVKAYGNVSNYYFKQRRRIKADVGNIYLKVAFWEGKKENSSMSPDLWGIYEGKAADFSGFYVYRDGFRVLPYGSEDHDFLEFEKNRSKSAGTYYFSYRKMIGFIGITKYGNQNLIDKSGREGFVSNDAYRSMKSMLMSFFKQIAKDKYGTHGEDRRKHTKELERNAIKQQLIDNEVEKNDNEITLIKKQLFIKKPYLLKLQERLIGLEVKAKEVHNDECEESVMKELMAQIETLNKDIQSCKIMISSTVSFAGYDEVWDRLVEYENARKSLENSCFTTLLFLSEKARVNVLVKQYATFYGSIREEYTRKFDEYIQTVTCELNRMKNEFAKKTSETMTLLEMYSPEAKTIDDCSKDEMISLRSELRSIADKMYGEVVNTYEPFCTHLSELGITSEWEKTFEAYKTKERELREQVDIFYELAQIGLAISVLIHELDMDFSDMSKSMNRLAGKAKENDEIRSIYESLNTNFNHLEDSVKQLSPLYRVSRKNKALISGARIEEQIRRFYDESFEEDSIMFKCSAQFREYIIDSYESLIFPVFTNIINNALYWVYYAKGKRIIKIDLIDDKVVIWNNGPSMSDSELDKCFNIFYSKRPNGKGIGLYLAKKCLDIAGYEIIATNDEKYNKEKGACFVIWKR